MTARRAKNGGRGRRALSLRPARVSKAVGYARVGCSEENLAIGWDVFEELRGLVPTGDSNGAEWWLKQ